MEDINVTELKKKLEGNEDFLLIDVREPYEYEAFNIGAKLIPLGQLYKELSNLKSYQNSEVVVLCEMGGRSKVAKMLMQRAGFKHVRNLTGGIEEWKETFED